MIRNRDLSHRIMHRSPVLGLLLCGAAGACAFEPDEALPPDGVAAVGPPRLQVSGALIPDSVVDLNGDGRADVCGRGAGGILCARSLTSVFGTTTVWQPHFSDAAGWNGAAAYYSTIRFPDVNGDGRADVCGRAAGGVKCGLGTGSSFGDLATWQSHFSDAANWDSSPAYYSTIRFPDLNGDGRADVCGRGAGGIVCALSNGAGFGTLTVWQSHFSDAAGWNAGAKYYSTIRFPDLNGDGRADVCGRGVGGIECALSTGAGFGPVTVWQSHFSDAANWDAGPKYYSTIQFPDIDGDGRADLCGRNSDGIVCARSTGTSFGTVTMWQSAFGDDNGWDQPQYYSTIQFPDLDGDGRADLCGRGTGGIDCALNIGPAFGGFTVWQPSFSDDAGWDVHTYYSTIQFADINGDGRADVCGRGRQGVDCALSAGTTFTSVSVWGSAFSNDAGWDASPSYYSTIRLP